MYTGNKETKMVKINEVVYKDKSWMKAILNKEDGFVNGSLLSDQVNIFLLREMRNEDIKNDIEHIKLLTGKREMYKADSVFDNVKGWYIHPFLALQLLAILKHRDNDYEEYYEFLKETIFEFLGSDAKFCSTYELVDMFYGE